MIVVSLRMSKEVLQAKIKSNNKKPLPKLKKELMQHYYNFLTKAEKILESNFKNKKNTEKNILHKVYLELKKNIWFRNVLRKNVLEIFPDNLRGKYFK